MDWDNEPVAWSESDDRLTLTVDGDTDFWRHTLHDLVADDDHTVAM